MLRTFCIIVAIGMMANSSHAAVPETINCLISQANSCIESECISVKDSRPITINLVKGTYRSCSVNNGKLDCYTKKVGVDIQKNAIIGLMGDSLLHSMIVISLENGHLAIVSASTRTSVAGADFGSCEIGE